MPNPAPSDGAPLPAGLVAVIDEAAAEVGGGVHYLLTGAVLLDHTMVSHALRDLAAERQRPIHWHREGSRMRAHLVSLMAEQGVVAHVLGRATGRTGQVTARRALLAALATRLDADGVAHLVIESRGAREDGRDRATLLDTFHDDQVPFTYDWRTKAEPLLGIADAIGGACREQLVDAGAGPGQQLIATGVIRGIDYL